MKILVTGSSGFIASHLISIINAKNEIIPFDLKEGWDIRNLSQLDEKMLGVDVIIHLAALVSAPESWQKPKEYFLTNGMGSLNVVLSAIKNKVKKIIYTSSAAIYGEPLTPYGASKKWGEQVLEVYKGKIETVIVRPFNIYGVGQNPAYGYVIHNFIKGIIDSGTVNIYGDGNQTRDFISVKDITETIKFLIEAKNIDNPIDLGTGVSTKITDLASTIGKILKKDYKINHSPARSEPYESKANLQGLLRAGIDPTKFTPLTSGLTQLIKDVYGL